MIKRFVVLLLCFMLNLQCVFAESGSDGVFSAFIGQRVDVEHEKVLITGLDHDFEGYTILVISDLNAVCFGKEQNILKRLLADEDYSLVLMLGDMVGPDGDTGPFYELIDLFIEARKPVYFIAGDSDPAPLLEKPREAVNGHTWRQMVLADWVLGAIEHGAKYLDCPVAIEKGTSKLWLVPDTYLNLNVSKAMREYNNMLDQQTQAYQEGVKVIEEIHPFTTYRDNLLIITRDIIRNRISGNDLVVMLSHEVPTDSQLRAAQNLHSKEQNQDFLPVPNVVFAGHYCGGEWKLPLIGTLYVDSDVFERSGLFPEEIYVQGQRSVGDTAVYVTPGLGCNAKTLFPFRLNNPPTLSLVALTGESMSAFYD